MAAFIRAELCPDHLMAAGTLTPAQLPARDLGHARLPYLPAPLRMLPPLGSVPVRRPSCLARSAGFALVMAAPACDTGGCCRRRDGGMGGAADSLFPASHARASHHRHQCSFRLLAGRSRAGDARLRATARNGLRDNVSTGPGHFPRGSIRPLQLDQSRPPMRAHRTGQMWAIGVMVGPWVNGRAPSVRVIAPR